MSTTRVTQHALEMLKQDDLWKWHDTKRIQASGKQSACSHFERIAPKFLHYLIKESLSFGDSVLEQFWKQLGACDEKLEENIETLRDEDFVSAEASFYKLFRGLDPKDVNLQPLLNMAAEYFTHLGVALMNPTGLKSGTGTESAVDEDVNLDTDQLLQELKKDTTNGKRKQGILKTLSFRRDGFCCLLTRFRFEPFFPRGVSPVLACVIPNTVRTKPATLNCIAMFAGDDIRDAVVKYLNNMGNIMNMEVNAHCSYNALDWGIEAKEEGGVARYFFRLAPTAPDGLGPDIIALREGDEIQFGSGVEGGRLKKPRPELCNLQLAVARVMKMSGAADIVLKWKEDADDGGWDGRFIASEDYCDMLDAKLFLSGRTVVV